MTYERAQALNDRYRSDAVAEDPFTLTLNDGSVEALYGNHTDRLVLMTRFDGTADIHDLCWSFFRLCRFAQRVERRRQEVLAAHQTVVMWGLRFRRVWANVLGQSRFAKLDPSGEELGDVPATARELEAGALLHGFQERREHLEWARDVYAQAIGAVVRKAEYLPPGFEYVDFVMPDQKRVRWNWLRNTIDSTQWPWNKGYAVYVSPQEG